MTTYTAPPGRGNIHGNPGGDGGNNIDPGLGPVQNRTCLCPLARS